MFPPNFPNYAPPSAPFNGQQPTEHQQSKPIMPHPAPPGSFNGYSNGASNGIMQQPQQLAASPHFPFPHHVPSGQNAGGHWTEQQPSMMPPSISKQSVYNNNQPIMQPAPSLPEIPRQKLQQHQMYNNNVSSLPVPHFQNNVPASSANIPPNHFQPPLPPIPQQHQSSNHMPMQPNQMPTQQFSTAYHYNNTQQQAPMLGAPSMLPPPHSQQVRYMDLMKERNLLGLDLQDNEIALPVSVCNPEVHCAPSVFRCTMSAIPETTELLNKCRLPLGLTLQPFRDLKNLTVIQTNIVRCRYCRTYINPYVYLPDNRHWKCNLCYRVNDLPEEFTWDPITKSFGDPSRRPELQNATMEYIAPNEYMLRPPQAALYLFIFDVSSNAVDCGYLHNFTEQLLINLDQMPGDDRTLIGFLGVDSALHFFQFNHPSAPPKQLVVYDVDEPFAPVNSGLIVTLQEFKESVRHFVQSLPTLYESNTNSSNCLGSALTLAKDLIAETGGRVTVLLASIPNLGPGALNTSLSNKVYVGPTTDFYKRLALECTGKQIGVDLFVMGERHVDIATLSEVAKFSSGSVYHFPGYHFIRQQTEVKRFQKLLSRYLIRKLGLEAVLRIRCSKGISLHTFYGNFFVRSTDLLAMANVNPDSAVGVQIQLEESLSQQHTVCFQAALLYTSTRGDRRIRVHTLCVPVISDFSTIFHYFDVKAAVSLLAKMAAERAMTGGELQDCREALINAATDGLAAYNRSVGQKPASLLVPVEGDLKFLSIFVLGLLKSPAFSSQQRSSVDQRVASMLLYKTAPLEVILLETCPALYSVHNIDQCEDHPQRLPLSYERVNKDGIYLLDTGTYVYLYVCSGVQPQALQSIFAVSSFSQLDEDEALKQLENPLSERLHSFLRYLNSSRGSGNFAPVVVLRDDSVHRDLFARRLVEDRTEASHSYVEFLQHLKREIGPGIY